MEATLTELKRNTKKVVRAASHGGKKVTLTDHGKPVAEIVPLRAFDRRAALKALIAIGPVEFLPRK